MQGRLWGVLTQAPHSLGLSGLAVAVAPSCPLGPRLILPWAFHPGRVPPQAGYGDLRNKAGFSAGVRGGRKIQPPGPQPFVSGVLSPWPPRNLSGRKGALAWWSAPALGLEGLRPTAGPVSLCSPPPPALTAVPSAHSRTTGLGAPLLLGCARPAPALWFLAWFSPQMSGHPRPHGRAFRSGSTVPREPEPCPPNSSTGSVLPETSSFPHALQSSVWSFCPGCQTHEHRAPAPRHALTKQWGGGGTVCEGMGALSPRGG